MRTPSEMTLAIARACHEVNRIYCQSIGDNSQLRWEDSPLWQTDSAVNGVLHRLKNPNSTPKDSHDNWLAHKAIDGWKFGPVKDVEKKEHPCFVPYADLPASQRIKDELFLAVCSVIDGWDKGET